MKKSLLITFFMITMGFIQAQIQDLASLAVGEIIGSNILYDSQDQVYGYIYFFDQGEVDKDNIQMEYVILDKNLNKVSNNTFIRKKYHKLLSQNYISCSLINNNELLLKFELNYKTLTFESYCIIYIKEKTISPDYWYKNGDIIEISKNKTEFNKQLKKVKYKGSIYVDRKHNAICIIERQETKKHLNKFIRYYNTKNELLWSYEYNPVQKINIFNTVAIENISQNNIYLLECNYNIYPLEYKIIALDPTNGKKKYEYIFENTRSKYNHTLISKEINNQLIICGSYSKFLKNSNFNLEKNLGFFKIVLDNNGKEIFKKYSQWNEFNKQIEIDKNGRVEKNFRLLPTSFYIFKDGTISILTEKYKPEKNGIWLPIPIIGEITQGVTKANRKTTDFILFSMDKDFNFKSVKTIQKELTKGYSHDYLFSQYIKNDTGIVFFFIDYLKSEKKWILGVNTIINGKIKEEKIPIYSKEDKYTIFPIKAKEGYIILNEYNEKEKYNQIRLEKINF